MELFNDKPIIKDIDGPRGWNDIGTSLEIKLDGLDAEIKELRESIIQLESSAEAYSAEILELQRELQKYKDRPTIVNEISSKITELKEKSKETKNEVNDIRSRIRENTENVRAIVKIAREEMPDLDQISLN